MAELFTTLLDLALPEKRRGAIEKLGTRGLINRDTLNAWLNELSRNEYRPRLAADVVAAIRIHLEKAARVTGGEGTTQKTTTILKAVMSGLEAADRLSALHLDHIKDGTVLDFGAGIYSPMAAALTFYANGFGRAIAYEPFPVEVDYAVASAEQTLHSLLFEPAALNFSGIADDAFKDRLASLDFTGLRSKLQALRDGEIDRIDLGGVEFTTSLAHVRDVSLVVSNSVLEHVRDLLGEVKRLHALLTEDGICVHTVDFTDHRNISHGTDVFEMYYDGVLSDINGLRPSQMETILATAGFDGLRINRLNIPEHMQLRMDEVIPAFAALGRDDLSVMLNTYVLHKRQT